MKDQNYNKERCEDAIKKFQEMLDNPNEYPDGEQFRRDVEYAIYLLKKAMTEQDEYLTITH